MNKKLRIGMALTAIFLLVGCDSKPTGLRAEGGNFWTDEQLAYLRSSAIDDTSPYCGNMSISAPRGAALYFKTSMKTKRISVYKDEGLTQLEATYVTHASNFFFSNGELGKKYYWTVSDKDSKKISEVSTIEMTLDGVSGPRNLSVSGVENFRDIGGWGRYVDGKYVTYMKQGLVYRSGRFNEDKETTPKVSIDESGLYEVNDHLKIRTEIDLRRSGNNEIGGLTTQSVLGENVKYVNLPMYYGGNNILTYTGKVKDDEYEYDNPKAIKQFFDIFADENNYPINFHCSIGKDRTGCMAYLIEGLLGFDKETMQRDYMFTNFANAGMCKLEDITSRYGKTIDDYTGETLQQKVYNYLNVEIGVSAENLNKIITLLGNN